MSAKYPRLIDLVEATLRGKETTTVEVDNDAVYAYDESNPDPNVCGEDLYDGDDPRDVLIELLHDLGVKARKP